MLVSWDISKGLDVREIHSDLHLHSLCFWAVVVLCSLLWAFRLLSVPCQWELWVCAGDKLSAETGIQLDISLTLAPVTPEARKDLLGAFFPFLRQPS